MYDLIILAMQTDLSRVITYRQPLEILLQALDITYSGHQVSHYHKLGGKKEGVATSRSEADGTFRSFH